MQCVAFDRFVFDRSALPHSLLVLSQLSSLLPACANTPPTQLRLSDAVQQAANVNPTQRKNIACLALPPMLRRGDAMPAQRWSGGKRPGGERLASTRRRVSQRFSTEGAACNSSASNSPPSHRPSPANWALQLSALARDLCCGGEEPAGSRRTATCSGSKREEPLLRDSTRIAQKL